jgi:hypothetical protein
MKCKHCFTSNSRECFRSFTGCKIIGVLFDAFPLRRRDLQEGTQTFVFDCGHAITFASNGSFWPESDDEVRQAIEDTRERIKRDQQDAEGILKLAVPEAR